VATFRHTGLGSRAWTRSKGQSGSRDEGGVAPPSAAVPARAYRSPGSGGATLPPLGLDTSHTMR